MSELCQPTDAELHALCASATGPSHLESLIPLANYRDIVALRRKLHEFPELANREHGTAATLRDELTAIDGVELLGFAAGGTGVLALIEGATTDGRTILFRADMDGLPIAEKADARATALADPTQAPCCALCEQPFKFTPPPTSTPAAHKKPAMSRVDGVSHACGHDGHMAMLVGAARLIAARRAELKGRVVLLFQPAEERNSITNPMGGAIRMVRDTAAGRKLADRLGIAQALKVRGSLLGKMGKVELALRDFEAALPLFVELDETRHRAATLRSLGELHMQWSATLARRRDVEGARRHQRRSSPDFLQKASTTRCTGKRRARGSAAGRCAPGKKSSNLAHAALIARALRGVRARRRPSGGARAAPRRPRGRRRPHGEHRRAARLL